MAELVSILASRKKDVIARWYDLILNTYAPETARLWRKEKNHIANPVGHKFQIGLTGIVDLFLEDDGAMDGAKYEPFLDEIVRVRAVQDFTPSQATAFIYLLKKAVRETLLITTKVKDIGEDIAPEEKAARITMLTEELRAAARELEFEHAA